jgi:hypothetical protein
MKRSWTLGELGEFLRLFPGAELHPRAVLRCVRGARGRGTFVRERNPEAFCAVTLQAWPADSFSLACTYDWPQAVSVSEAETLDRALLQGFVEGASRAEQPPWRAGIVCTEVVYKAGLTNANAVRVAASVAVQDLVEHGDWIVEGQPTDVA